MLQAGTQLLQLAGGPGPHREGPAGCSAGPRPAAPSLRPAARGAQARHPCRPRGRRGAAPGLQPGHPAAAFRQAQPRRGGKTAGRLVEPVGKQPQAFGFGQRVPVEAGQRVEKATLPAAQWRSAKTHASARRTGFAPGQPRHSARFLKLHCKARASNSASPGRTGLKARPPSALNWG